MTIFRHFQTLKGVSYEEDKITKVITRMDVIGGELLKLTQRNLSLDSYV